MTQGTAGVVAPPPLIYLAGLALGLLVEWLAPLPGFGLGAARFVLGGLLLLGGGSAALPALLGFRRAGTAAEPWKPSSALVTGGIYRITRNPMYLGLALVYAALALFADSPATLLLLAPVLVAVRYGVIGREERYLEALFGQDYRDYKARVRRWL